MPLSKMTFLALLTSINAHASVERISSIYKDLGQVQKIYLHAGLISLIEFPQNILEVKLGNPKSIKAELSSVSPRELTLFLSDQHVEPTNLLVRSEKKLYVFDIIPSVNSHQDYVKIIASYGSPSLHAFTSTKTPKQRLQGKLKESVSLGGGAQ